MAKKYATLTATLENLPALVRAKRNTTGATYRDVGAATGINASTIHRIENGANYLTAHAIALLGWLDH